MSKFKVGDVLLYRSTKDEYTVIATTSAGKCVVEFNNGKGACALICPDDYFLKPKKPIKSVRGIALYQPYEMAGYAIVDNNIKNQVTFFFDAETKELIDVKMGDHS